MTAVTFGAYVFDTEALRGRGFLTPYVVNGVTYEYETAMRVAASLDMAAKLTTAQATVTNVGALVDTIFAVQSTLALVWDSGTADANPGVGDVRASTAALTSGGYTLYVSTTDALGGDATAVLADYGASTSATKGRLRLVKIGNSAVYIDVNIIGVTTATGYRKVAVTYLAGPGGFSSGDAVAVGFVRFGDTARWLSGAGAPSNGTGNDGDQYVNVSNGVVYAKAGGVWSATGANLLGPSGNNKISDGGTAGGTANALTCTASPTPVLAQGQAISLKTGASANTGAATLNPNGLGVSAIQKNGAALVSGDLPASTRMLLLYDGAAWQIVGGGSALPSQTGNGTKFLLTDGTNASWASISEAAILPTASVTGTSQMMSTSSSYIANNASRVTLTLPTTSAVGDLLEVLYFGAGGWKVAQNASQYVIWGGLTTTAGVTDGLISVGSGATVRMKCVQANTAWEVIAWSGAVSTVLTSTQSFNPAYPSGGAVLSGGNQIVTMTGGGAGRFLSYAIPTTGKYYCQFKINDMHAWQFFGLSSATTDSFDTAVSYRFGYKSDGTSWTAGTSTTVGTTLVTGSVVGLGIDRDNGKLFAEKDGVYVGAGNPVTGANPTCLLPGGTYYVTWAWYDGAGSDSVTFRPAASQWTLVGAPAGYTNLP